MEIKRPQSKQPIPKHAKKVFEGVIFDVYQWEQPMYDGSTATFEKLKRPDTVIVYPITRAGKIVLTHQEQPGKKPFIGAAGGRVDQGEDILDAAKRELREETGYGSDNWILWDAIQPISKIDWVIYTFIAYECDRVGDLELDAGEKIEIMHVTSNEFLEIALDERFAEHEIYSKILEAKLSEEKMQKFRSVFANPIERSA